jgi:hypothetical protein
MMPFAYPRHVLCRLAVSFALALLALAAPLRADTELRFEFRYLEADLPAPSAEVVVTDLFTDTAIAVTPQEAAEGLATFVAVLSPAQFDGPYARLRVAVSGLALPPGDSKSGEDIRFAFEMVLRRDLLDGPVVVQIPVVTTSRRQAMKPYMAMPDLIEDLPNRFFLAQQWMSLYQASPDAVAAAPQAFALHRLIARAVVDFAIATADVRRGPVLILPAPELAQTLDLYWSSMPEGKETHLAAYADARTILWLDVPLAEDLLRQARRSGIEAPAVCNAAREHLDFFARRLPEADEAAWVDAMFPVPGSLAGYLEGRRLDIIFACTRLRI